MLRHLSLVTSPVICIYYLLPVTCVPVIYLRHLLTVSAIRRLPLLAICPVVRCRPSVPDSSPDCLLPAFPGRLLSVVAARHVLPTLRRLLSAPVACCSLPVFRYSPFAPVTRLPLPVF